MKVAALCVLLALFSGSQSKPPARSDDGPVKYDLDPDRLPENVAVVENTEVTLNCAVFDHEELHAIQWWEYVYGPLAQPISENILVGQHPERERYTIIHGDDAEYSLRISPVVMADGGLYECRDSRGNPANKQRHQIMLTVVAVRPNCTTTLPATGVVLEHQYHVNECSLSYKGILIPNITWSGIGPFQQAYVATPTSVWSGMEYSVTRNMDVRSHISDTFFSGYFLPVPNDMAENVPTYSYSHRERQMFVYWGPTDIQVHPTKPYYEVGDILVCTADAFPPPDFSWTNSRTGFIYPGDTIEVEEEWLGHFQTLRCEARNIILDQIYSANIFVPVDVPVPTTTTPPPTTPTTTFPPAVSRCGDLTGAWESVSPGIGGMCIRLDIERNGILTGLVRNGTDSWWVDVVGRAHADDFDQVAFAGIQPLDFGVSSFIGECHRCFGIERILAHVTTRPRGLECGNPGVAKHTDQYEFYRSSTLFCPNLPPSKHLA